MINYDAKEAESIVVEFIFASMDYVIDFDAKEAKRIVGFSG